MSIHCLVSPFFCSPTTTKLALHGPQTHTCQAKRIVHVSSLNIEPQVARRSANYSPNIWDFGKLMSLTSPYKEDRYKKEVDELKERARQLLKNSVGTKCSLDMIDAIKRLGVGYHYKEEIKAGLDNVFVNREQWFDEDLYTTSLAFRLLRQHGYDVPQDVFDKFRDKNGNFEMSLCEDGKGLLSLYEASYLGLEGEDLMDEAKAFAKEHLKDFKISGNTTLMKKISHSLELPLHWRISRLESIWYINVYEGEDNMIPVVLDLAKLDYNIVQATYQCELGKLTRWWVNLGLHKMNFFRDRILEAYFWSIGIVHEPQFGRCRIGLSQVTTLITVIDDIYDVYGSLEELLLFTDAIERWNVSAMEQLPNYMKVCYMAMLNNNNEIAYEILNEHGVDITSNQRKAWVHLTKAYLVEAKWFYKGYTPSLDEYLENAWRSIAAHLILMTSYLLTTEKVTKEALDCIDNMPSLIHHSALLVRLADDLGTSSDEIARGDVPKSIQCYMYEAGVSEEVAREYVKYLINETWKKVNKARLGNYPFSEPFIESCPNFVRQAQCMYQYGDGYGIPDQETKDRLNSLLVEPIPLNYG